MSGAGGDPAGTAGVGAGMGQADTNRRASNSQPALTLMEMNEKGRHARTYRQSQVTEGERERKRKREREGERESWGERKSERGREREK